MLISEKKLIKWGGETLITFREKSMDAWIILAVHSTKKGPAAGGIRLKNYNSVENAIDDSLRLSEAMTYKFATANMDWGGGKTVVSVKQNIDEASRRKLLLKCGEFINGLNGKYYAGPDSGTSSLDMDFLYKSGTPYVFSRTSETGGAGSSSIPTAIGVFSGIQTLCKFIFDRKDLTNIKVLVQGAGNVGGYLMNLLRESGAKVLFNETNNDLIKKYCDLGYKFIKTDDLFKTECDIFSPCAQGEIFNTKTIAKLKCKGICGAANNQLSEDKNATDLMKAGIVYAPDYVANLGGAMGITAIETLGISRKRSFDNVKKAISETLEAIFKIAERKQITTVESAKEIALNGIN